jgi:hypothetical protein
MIRPTPTPTDLSVTTAMLFGATFSGIAAGLVRPLFEGSPLLWVFVVGPIIGAGGVARFIGDGPGRASKLLPLVIFTTYPFTLGCMLSIIEAMDPTNPLSNGLFRKVLRWEFVGFGFLSGTIGVAYQAGVLDLPAVRRWLAKVPGRGC